MKGGSTNERPAKKRPGGGLLRRAVKVVAAAALVCVAAFVLLTATSAVASELFWAGDSTNIPFDAGTFDEEVAELLVAYDEQDASVSALEAYAEDMPSEFEGALAEYNGYIEAYCSEVWGVDVSATIEAVGVYQVDLWQADNELADGGTISAFSDCESRMICLSTDLIDMGPSDDMFLITYVHEMVHQFCLTGDEDGMQWLMEGFTECITELIFEYNGLAYYNYTGYEDETAIAKQLVAADSSIVGAMLADSEGFSLVAWLDERTDGYGQELGNVLFLNGYGGYTEGSLLLRAQYITAQYCRAVAPESAQQIVGENSTVPYFELRALLHGWS